MISERIRTVHERMSKPENRPVLIIVAATLTLVVSFFTYRPWLTGGGDNAEYMILATGNPFLSDKFPPLYPLLLKLFAGSSLLTLKLLSVAAAYGIALVLGFAYGPLPALLFPLQLVVVEHMGVVLPDMLFALTILLAFILYCGVHGSDRDDVHVPHLDARPRPALYLFATAAMIKTAGLAFLLGAVLHSIIKRRDYSPIVPLSLVLPLAWVALTAVRGSNGYLHYALLANPYDPTAGFVSVGGLILRMWRNAFTYLMENPLIALGFYVIISFRPKMETVGYITVPYILLILAWPWHAGRFVLPFAALSVPWAAALGVGELRHKAILTATVLISFVILIPAVSPRQPPSLGSYSAIAGYARKALPADAVVCARKANIFTVLSGRKAIPFPNVPPDSLWRYMRDNHVTHVVVDRLGYPSTVRFLIPAMSTYSDSTHVVAQAIDRTRESYATVLLALDQPE